MFCYCWQSTLVAAVIVVCHLSLVDGAAFDILIEAQGKINNNTIGFCYTGHSGTEYLLLTSNGCINYCIFIPGTKKAFLDRTYSKYLDTCDNTLVYPFCLHAGGHSIHLLYIHHNISFNNQPSLLLSSSSVFLLVVVVELGNRLGNYFTELGCAETSGLNFMTIHHKWDLTGTQ